MLIRKGRREQAEEKTNTVFSCFPFSLQSSAFSLVLLLTVCCLLLTVSVARVIAAEKDYWADMGVARIGGKKPVIAPEFTLSALDGKKVSLKDFRGKVVFLNFWATWCPPCVVEMPSMESLHKKFKGEGLVVVAVNSEESAEKVARFIKKKGYTFPVLLDTDGTVSAESYKAIGFPTTYLIDRRGLAIGKVEGAREWDSDEAIKLMEEILKK